MYGIAFAAFEKADRLYFTLFGACEEAEQLYVTKFLEPAER